MPSWWPPRNHRSTRRGRHRVFASPRCSRADLLGVESAAWGERPAPRRRLRRVGPLPALLALLVFALVECPPVGSALAIMTSQASVPANTLNAATAFPRCYG